SRRKNKRGHYGREQFNVECRSLPIRTSARAEGNCKEAPCLHRATLPGAYGVLEMACTDLLAQWEKLAGSSGLHGTCQFEFLSRSATSRRSRNFDRHRQAG